MLRKLLIKGHEINARSLPLRNQVLLPYKSYKLIQGKVFTKFHRLKKQSSPLNDQIVISSEDFNLSPENKCQANKLFSDHKLIGTNLSEKWFSFFKKRKYWSYSLDWTRGRFSGRVVSLLVRDGIVVQKEFITPKGARILVKRKELGLQALFLT